MLQLLRDILDDNTRVYHSKTKLTHKKIEAASCGEDDTSAPEGSMGGIGVAIGLASTVVDPSQPVSNELLKLIVAIAGVNYCIITPYACQIQKARMWDWNEIEPKLLLLLGVFNLDLETIKEVEDK